MTMPPSASPRDDGERHDRGDVRVVDRLAALGAALVHGPPLRPQVGDDGPPQRDAGVIAADRHAADVGRRRPGHDLAPVGAGHRDAPIAQRVGGERRDVAARRQFHRAADLEQPRVGLGDDLEALHARFLPAIMSEAARPHLRRHHRRPHPRAGAADRQRVSARRPRPHGVRAEGRLHLPGRPGAPHVAAGDARLHRGVELRQGHDQLRRGPLPQGPRRGASTART